MPVPSQDLDFNVICHAPLFVFSQLRREVIVSFDDIGGIVDHHCLDFHFLRIYFFISAIN